ncbi:hypothetical protein CC1G_02418 [Coprinopsis cinerea okayama7|uniref:Uncharacterized protein n=1 Tax=Coprinopsis cinerea (strain Okayama-7 / 130 / ATCC MYA-4618 / FGSC 9003) TaxID=240176 RepID=A8NBF8_COPC7|nr:hypothetical protein CC1G_02418 [Coprinopsis cinerea okayama7\|eukprot:XP_001832156.1 hypothetical protein CC1G_02418 [Coprinopsis cinerea okayama7\
MGRPRKYTTIEERKEAAKRASKRYYSRNKDDINRLRREAYREQHPKRTEVQMARVRERDEIAAAEGRNPATWIARARALVNRSEVLVGPLPRKYLDDLCQSIFSTASSAPTPPTLATTISQFSRLQKQSGQCEATVLDVAGAGDDWKEVRTLVKPIQDILLSLEEIETITTTLGPRQLEEEWSGGSLHYQSVWNSSTAPAERC